MSIDDPNWTLVAQLPLSQNLDSLIQQLEQRNISHRLVVDEQRQSIWVENPESILEVNQLLKTLQKAQKPAKQDLWSSAPVGRTKQHKTASGQNWPKQAVQLFRHFPVVMWGITLSVVGALLVKTSPDLARAFFFPVFEQWSIQTSWRWLTPIFLHFGISHIVFNSLWLWVFGSRLEQVCGSRQLLWIVLITGLSGNLAQYLWSHANNFGGMSGVVYGLMGYVWVRQMRNPHPLLAFPPMLFGMMLFFLLLGITGMLSSLMGSGIANAAHLGGLLAGMAMAWYSAQRPRR